MSQEVITVRESLVSGSIGGTAIVSPTILTADLFNQTVIFGATIGFWLAILGSISLLIVLILNIKKFYTQIISPLIEGKKINLDE